MNLSCWIDDREQKRIKPAYEFFKKNNIQTYIMELPIGDYIFKGDNGINVAFEYKTIEDYLNSLSDNRVFNQALDQSNNFDYHFIIIVGTETERSKAFKRYTGRYISLKEFYGSIGSLVNITSILQVPNLNHALYCMEATARHCINMKPVLKRFKKSRGTPALRLLANNVNGIGFKTAKLICDELDVFSVNDVLRLDFDDLVSVKGVGVKTAESILLQLNGG